jgi:hypothetical protein
MIMLGFIFWEATKLFLPHFFLLCDCNWCLLASFLIELKQNRPFLEKPLGDPVFLNLLRVEWEQQQLSAPSGNFLGVPGGMDICLVCIMTQPKLHKGGQLPYWESVKYSKKPYCCVAFKVLGPRLEILFIPSSLCRTSGRFLNQKHQAPGGWCRPWGICVMAMSSRLPVSSYSSTWLETVGTGTLRLRDGE